jgi:hypothetical protein
VIVHGLAHIPDLLSLMQAQYLPASGGGQKVGPDSLALFGGPVTLWCDRVSQAELVALEQLAVQR